MSLYGQAYGAGYGQEAYYRPGAGAARWGPGVTGEGEEEEDFEAEEEEAESPDDSSDSDYAGGSRKKAKAKQAGGGSRRAGRTSLAKPRAGRAAGASRVAAAAAPKKRTRKRAAYADDDEDSALEETSDSEADSEPAGYGAGGSRRRHGAAAAAAPAVARRPRRQAAARANANIKHTYEEPDEFEEADGDAAANAFDEHAAAAAAPVPATQFAQFYAQGPEPHAQRQQQQDEWQYPAAAQNGGSRQHSQQHTADLMQQGGQVWDAAGGYGYGAAYGGTQGYAQTMQQDSRQEAQQQQQQQQETWQDQHQQQGQQLERNHQQQQWQRSHEPPSPQPQQLAVSQQQRQQPSPAPRRTSAPLAASRAASNRPGARGSGSGRSASAAVTPSRRPSRAAAAAAARSSYYEGSGDSEAELEEEQEAAGVAFWDNEPSSSGGDGPSGEGESGSGDEAGSDGAADYEYALQMQEELNGMRARHTRQQGQASRRNSSAAVGHKRGGASVATAGGSQKRRRARATATKISYAESGDSSDDSEARAAAAAARRELVPALEDTGDGWEAEGLEEVERVLGHRAAAATDEPAPEPGAAGAAGADPWSCVEFHVKWRRLSFIHTSWQPLEALRDLPGFKRVLNYIKRVDAAAANRANLTREELELIDVSNEMEQQLLQQYTQVERVIAERPGQSRSLLVKWEGLPYCEATWEAAEDVMAAQGGPEARDEFLTRQQRMQETARAADAARNAIAKSAGGTFQELQEQPAFLSAGRLRQYQLEGLNWLTYAWLKGNNTILADEMGLGKTVQCVSLVGLLAQHMSVRGPFLVVVPLSTVPNWIKEFRKWVPMVNAVVYVGDGRSRDVIRAFEFPGAPSNRSRPYGFEAIITTYELVLKDAALLRQIHWQYLLVDEAHRLKNSDSALYQELSTWSFKNKLLVTGTPLQNSMRELWCLLNFLEPGRFGAAEEFEAAYKVEGAAVSSLSSLHSSLKPHLLRRVIKDVETSLPPKTERILRVEMTPLQRQYYKWILSRNFKELNKGARGQVSLLNIIIELKKACNHPFLFESAEDEYRLSDEHTSAVDRLVVSSGKMVLLDKLMRRLRETGHRVLIFSQMVRVLDIISDYLRLRGYPHQRLDGSTPAAARHAAMEAFNRPDSPDFAFLLSTRAGGLGINLATADTVIIFDSDWNPQNDLQAMSRAHRIGQTETVNIYRFVTSGSVEEEILERAKRKMVLDHLVIQRMDTSGRTVLGPAADNKGSKMFGKDELAAILRFGAEDLFAAAEVGSAERSRRLLEEDIDDILLRSEVVGQQPGQQSVAGGASDLLSSFNVATFKNEEDDATFWSRLISEPDRPQDELNAPLGPRAARTKQQQQQQQQQQEADGAAKSASRSPPGSRQPSSQQLRDASPPRGGGSRSKPKKARRPGGAGGSSRGSDKPGAPVEGAVLRIDVWPLEPTQDGKTASNTRSLGKRDAVAFVRAVRRYGLRSRLPDIASEAGGAVEAVGRQAQELLWEELVQGCRQALERAAEQDKQQDQLHDPRDVTLDFFGCAVKASEFSQHLAAMELLSAQVKALQSRGQDPCVSFRLEAAAVPPAAKWGKALGWTPRDDAALLLGVYFHGLGHMEELVADARLGLQAKLGSVLSAGGSTSTAAATQGRGEEPGGEDKAHVAPKASHLETRVLGILRKMLAISGQPARTNSRPRGHKAQKSAAAAPEAPAAAAGGAAATGAVGTAGGGAAERKAAKKAAAKRAAALAAAGITAVRNTPTPPPPPVHLQAAGGRQLGLAQSRPPTAQQAGKQPVGGPPAAAAGTSAADAHKQQQATAQVAAAGEAAGVRMQHSSSQNEGPAAPAQPAAAEAAPAQPAAAPLSRAVSPFAGPAAAGLAGSGLPVPPPRAPPPLPSSPTPQQLQQQPEEDAAVPPPPPPPPLTVDGASPAAAAADGPTRAAGQPEPLVSAPPPPAPADAVAVAVGGDPTSSPAAQPPTEQQLQALLAPVSSEMRGLLQLNTSAAAGEEQEDEHQVVRLTKAYLIAIGQAVQHAAAAHPALEQQLWAYVVSSVQTPMTQQKFASLCRKLVAKSTTAAAGSAAPGSSSMAPAVWQLPLSPAPAAAADSNHGSIGAGWEAGEGRAITPGKDLPCFHAEEQQLGASPMQQQQQQQQRDASPMQQQQQQQQQQAGVSQEQASHRDAQRLAPERGRVQAGSRDPSRERRRGRGSSSRSRSRDRDRFRGSNRDQSDQGRARGRRSSSSSSRSRSRSSSRDRGRDSQRRAARSRSTERYSSRGYGQHRQYSSRRYRSRSRSRSRSREYRQPHSSSRYSRGRRSYSRSRSSSRGRSRSYGRGRDDRRGSRSRSRHRRSRSYSRARRHSYSRDRDRRQPRRRSGSRSSTSRSRS